MDILFLYFICYLHRTSFSLSIFHLGTAEKLAIKEYSASIGKSKDIMEHYINVLSEQGISKIDIWLAPSDISSNSEERADVEDKSLSPQALTNQSKDRSTNAEDKEAGKHKVLPIDTS